MQIEEESSPIKPHASERTWNGDAAREKRGLSHPWQRSAWL